MNKDTFTQTCDFIEEHIGEVKKFPKDNVLAFEFKYKNTVYQAFMEVGEKILSLTITTPIAIPEGCTPDIAHAICLVNYNLKIGRFDLDCQDGSFEFHASTLFVDQIDNRVIDHLMKVSIVTLDRFYSAMLSIVFGNENPEDAIRCVRNELERDQ